jgi:predicted glutamine amidotransferase
MCRWLAYSGSPIRLDELLYKPQNSLIHQSVHSRLGVEPMNGDGFGVGWYGVDAPTPTLFRGIAPAWSDENLRELSRSVSSPLFLAHIRASTGTPVQQTNCHPFRYERWLWVHNGAVREYPKLRRDLTFAVDPGLYPNISGSTDSEVMFHLALTFGLQDDPVVAVERLIGFVESVGQQHGVARPLQMTVGTTDGDRLWAFRYSSERNSRSLYFSTAVSALRDQYPDNENLHRLSEESRIVVSEPLGDLEGAWQPIPECSYGVAQKGADWLGRLRPKAP